MAKRRENRAGEKLDVWETSCGYLIRQRGGRYQVDMGTVAGKRRRKDGFATVADAERWSMEESTRLVNQGTASLTLSERDRLELVTAMEKLSGVPLLTAVDFYLKHHPVGNVPTIRDLIREYLNAPGRRGKKTVQRRDVTRQTLKRRLNVFATDYGTLAASEVSQELIEGWLDVNAWEPQNRQHYLSAVHGMFEYAARKKYVAENPAGRIAKPTVPHTDPEILTPKQVESLLRTAAESMPEILPRLTMAFFCGLRQEELERLTWDSVSLENGLVTIGGDVTKIQGHKRHVDIPEAGKAWLSRCVRTDGPVWPFSSKTTLHRKRVELAKLSGVKIPQNAGRHAFASYHYAAHGSAAKTAEQLGHVSGVKLLVNRYRNIQAADGRPITKAAAERFWTIRPKWQSDVIDFPKAQAS